MKNDRVDDAAVTDVRPARSVRRRRWLRRGGLGALALAVLLGLGLAWGESTGWPVLRGPLERWASARAGVPVQLAEPFELQLLREPGVKLGRLTIAPAHGMGSEPLLDASELEARWRWRDVFDALGGNTLRLLSLRAATLDARLLREPDGRASWQVGRRQGGSAAEQRPSAKLPQFGELALRQGRIVIDDKPFETRLALELEGIDSDDEAARRGRADLGYRASVRGQWRALALDLKLRTGSALPLLREYPAGAPAPQLALEVQGRAGAARLHFEGWAADLLGARQIDGALRFAGPSLARVGEPLGLTLPQTPAFELAGRLAHDAGVWRLDADSAAIGRSQLGGHFVYDGRPKPGRLSGTLTGARLALADLGPSVGARTGGAPERPTATVAAPAQRSAARVLPDRRFDLPSLKGMDADVQVAIDELDFGSRTMAPLRGLRTQVLLQAGVLQLQGLKAQVAGGALSGSTRLDGTRDPAQWDAKLRFGNVEVSNWLRGLRASGRRSVDGSSAYLTGRLDAQVDVHGQGRSTAEILGSMDGRARVMLRDGTLSHLATEAVGLDLAQLLGVVVRGDRALPLRCARAALSLQDGVASTRDAVVDNSDSTIRLRGSVNLRDETLAVAARAQPKDFSPLALRSPITVTGTLSAPKVGVEGGKLVGKVLGALALGAAVGPVAALVPLVDPGQRNVPDPCAASG